jgi:hypothetical protein
LSLDDHVSSVLTAAFSPDGRQIASASNDRSVLVWDARPATPETAARRQAIAFLESRASRNQDPKNLIKAIQEDTTLSEPVRQQALGLAEPYYRGLVHEAAADRIQSLSRALLLKAQLIEAVAKDPGLADPVREEALRLVDSFVETPQQLRAESRRAASSPGKKDSEYELALTLIQTASQLDPECGADLTTLGMVYFRLRRYAEAAEALTGAGELPRFDDRQDGAARLAFLAMSEQALGKQEEALAALRALREKMQQPQWAKQAGAKQFLREAEQYRAGRPAAAPK